MKVGVVFSQADSGTDPEAIREWARTAEAAGFQHLMAYAHVLADGVARLRAMTEAAGRDPASLPIHGRVYLGDGFEARVEQAVELGFSYLSIGLNRILRPGHSHAEHLELVLEAKPTVDRIVGTA